MDTRKIIDQFKKMHKEAFSGADNALRGVRKIQLAGEMPQLFSAVDWRPVSTFTNDIAPHGFYVHAPSLVHADWNPLGVSEAGYMIEDDGSFIVAHWMPNQDGFTDRIIKDVTHWMPKFLPPNQQESS